MKHAHKTGAACGRNITPVQEAVHKNALNAFLLCKVEHGKNVRQMAVDPSVRKQTQHMQGFPVLLRIVNRFQIDRIPEKLSFRNFLADLRKNLEHDPAGPDIRMADFGVAHLALRKADIHSGRLQLRMRILFKQCIQIRLLRLGNGIARRRRSNAITVQDNQSSTVF